MKIDIKDLSYIVDNHKILNNINLSLGEYKMTGIIGPNGSGKTTLLRHLYGEIKTKNKIFLDGKDISSIKSKELAKKMATLTQFNEGVDPNLRVADIVLMGRYPHKDLMDIYDENDYKIADDMLKKLDLYDKRDRKIYTLSGGELQRVFMAKIFATEPEIILMDEPTNHLDIRYKIEFMEILKKFNGPVIITLHDLSLCAKYCDLCIVLNNGELYSKGNPKEILNEEILKKIYGVNYRVLYEPEFIIYY